MVMMISAEDSEDKEIKGMMMMRDDGNDDISRR